MIEKDFVTEGLKRTRIDEYLENELERAGYGGMEIQVTPLGTMVVVYAERPGMVIGRGGKTVRNITQNLKNNYDLENPQVEVKEVDVPELNPKIMAHKIAAMLQRGMHFRRVAYTALRRIMGAGAQGVEVTISGKIRGSRSACAKFIDGYIKKCGEPSTRFVREGFATVQLKPGVLGIYVRIMPPGIILPDKVDILQPAMEETPADTIMEDIEEPTTTDIEKPKEETISDQVEDEIAEAENIEDIEEIEEEATEEKETAKPEEKEPVKEKEPAKAKTTKTKKATKEESAKEEKEKAKTKTTKTKKTEPAKKKTETKTKQAKKPAKTKKETAKTKKVKAEAKEEDKKASTEAKKEPAKAKKASTKTKKAPVKAKKTETEKPTKTFKTAEWVKPATDKK